MAVLRLRVSRRAVLRGDAKPGQCDLGGTSIKIEGPLRTIASIRSTLRNFDLTSPVWSCTIFEINHY